MKPLAQLSGALLLSVLALPAGLVEASEGLSPAFTSPSQPLLLARGGGGRGAGGGGGRHGGGEAAIALKRAFSLPVAV